MTSLFSGIFDSTTTTVITPSNFLLCVCSALVIGLILAFFYMYNTRHSKSFVATLALLPAIVCVVIMMVNGNVGTGVAVAGAFSLVRFRSAAGTAKEIGAIFLAMCCGLICGMGYLGYAFLCAILLGGVFMLYSKLNFGDNGAKAKTLNITIPEDLNYTDVFDPIMKAHTSSYELTRVKTTNMGSLFRLTYDITLHDAKEEKVLIDELRTRNGNLEISVSNQQTSTAEL